MKLLQGIAGGVLGLVGGLLVMGVVIVGGPTLAEPVMAQVMPEEGEPIVRVEIASRNKAA